MLIRKSGGKWNMQKFTTWANFTFALFWSDRIEKQLD